MAKDTKNINIEVPVDCWKKIKIISVMKDITIQEVVKEILEKAVSKKQIEEVQI